MIGLGAMAVVLIVIALISAAGARGHGLRADVLSTRRSEPGEPVAISISVRDNYGVTERVDVDFGDGKLADPKDIEPTGCRSDFARTETFDYSHTYEVPGVYTVRTTVTSGGCNAKVETVTAVRTIEVKKLRRR